MMTFVGLEGEAEAFDGLEYYLVPEYVKVFAVVFAFGCCLMIGYYAGRRAGWREGIAHGRMMQEVEIMELRGGTTERSVQADVVNEDGNMEVATPPDRSPDAYHTDGLPIYYCDDEEAMDPDYEARRHARYLGSELCEVSDPEYWQSLHHGNSPGEFNFRRCAGWHTRTPQFKQSLHYGTAALFGRERILCLFR